jgi:hypothetical protein
MALLTSTLLRPEHGPLSIRRQRARAYIFRSPSNAAGRVDLETAFTPEPTRRLERLIIYFRSRSNTL